MSLDSRQNAISNFLESCKAIQFFSEYIYVNVQSGKDTFGPFQLKTTDEVEELMELFPKGSFTVFNTLCLNKAFVDELQP